MRIGVDPDDLNLEHGPRNVDPSDLTSCREMQQTWEQDPSCDMGIEPAMLVEISETAR